MAQLSISSYKNNIRYLSSLPHTGLIATDWGGTAIELWSSPDALAKCGVKDKYDCIKEIVTL